MYFYDLMFDGNKIVFPEYMTGQIFTLNPDFTVDTTILDEEHYGCLCCGIYINENSYIFSSSESKTLRKYIKESKKFIDIEVKNLPSKDVVRFKHDEVFVYKDRIIIITYNNEILISDLTFSEIKYVKSIYEGKTHRQIAENDEYLYIPIENKIFYMEKDNFAVGIFAELDQDIDLLFRNSKGIWALTNNVNLISLSDTDNIIDLSNHIHYYGDIEKGQLCKYINAYCNGEKVLLIPCYCDNLLLFDMEINQVTDLKIENEIENDITLCRRQRKNIQKYISSCQHNRSVLFLSSSSEILYSFDFETCQITECARGINGKSVISIELRHNKIIDEQIGGVNLTNYIENIISQ